MVDTSKLIEKYNNGYSLIKLSREFGISTYKIKKILNEKNVRVRTQKEQNKFSPQNQRKFFINDNYFSEQNHNMAYLLGFIAADGCIYEKNNTIKIALSSVDVDFLKKISEEMDSTFPIKIYENNKGFSICEVRYTSEKIKQNLAEYGIIPRKTYSFTFPSKLKEEYYLDFIRGYFDGDGSVSTQGDGAIRFSICAYNQEILKKIIDIFESYGVPSVNIYKRKEKRLFYFDYSTNSTKKIYSLLYKDDCLFLPRKKDKYQSLIENRTQEILLHHRMDEKLC